ncbi:MAG: response regulator [Deltaproteobacteria bacterium]
MAGRNIVLLALKEKEERDKFVKFLDGKGFDSLSVGDGAKAIEIALKEAVSLIVVDLTLPVISGERLFQILKNNPKSSKIPFIFLSDTQVEIRGFRVGTDVLLMKPFKWEEMYGHIKRVELIKGDDSEGGKDIQGKLSQMSLVDILQILHFNKKEGELFITSGALAAIVYIKDGNIYNASLGEVEREKALYRLLSWQEGTFEFHPTAVTTPQRIQGTAGNLLMEGMRQLDEFEKARDLFPEGDSVLKTSIDTTTLPKGLKPIIYEILFLIEYYPRVNDLVDHCSFPDYDVFKTLSSLLTRRIIEEIKSAPKTEKVSEEFVSPTLAIRVKEKVITRWADMLSVNFGRFFLTAANQSYVKDFLMACKSLPDFSVDRKLAASSRDVNENTFGEVGSLNLYGDMDVVLFSVPASGGMGPFLNAFIANLIGMAVIWGDEDDEVLKEFANTRKEITSRRRIPVLYIYAGKAALGKEAALKYRHILNIKADEPIFTLSRTKEFAYKIFQELFEELVREDYISTGNYA